MRRITEECNAVCISLDLELGGNKFRVTQLSAVLFHVEGIEDSALFQDVMIREVFRKFFRPPSNAEWNLICQENTGLHAQHPKLFQTVPDVDV